MSKTEIVARLGESAVLLPGLIAESLAANDRLKVRLSLLQAAAAQAAAPQTRPNTLDIERRACGLDDPRLDALVPGARAPAPGRLTAPGLSVLLAGLGPDLEAMLAPLKAVETAQAGALEARLTAIVAALPSAAEDQIDAAAVAAMASARAEGPDSAHRLVMDLHKAINRLAAETAPEDLDGAKVHHLAPEDRPRVKAFMAGLNRTAPLAFGHPGLGATATRVGPRLVIQNDIGETDAHVLIAHVEGRVLTVTYTDVHRRRAKFFMSLFQDRMTWSPLAEHAAEGLGEDAAFYLVTGRGECPDDQALDDLLAFLGSRIVFLIDWNKGRKALQSLIDKDSAITLMAWAAAHDVGHRAFLELGGADMVFEAIRRAAAGRVPYGTRLDAALGPAETADFLRKTLRECAEGLKAGRSVRLIRDEIQAYLAERFESAETAVLAILVRHLGLSRTLAAAAGALIDQTGPDEAPARADLARRAKRLEAKADALTLQARDICSRLQDSQGMRRLIDSVEDAMDALDECAFLISLAPPGRLGPKAEMSRLAHTVAQAIGALVQAVEAASRLPDGRQADAVAALQSIDAVTRAEREADDAERAAIGAIMAVPPPDARALFLGVEVARSLESVTDHIAHAAFALRARILEGLSA
jgi:uncharacterized protein Yka (UPF0111/DUF47 family)